MFGNYPPDTWNVYDLEDCMTNNHIEGWHSKMRKAVGKAHPNVYELVQIFKTEHAAVEALLVQLATRA